MSSKIHSSFSHIIWLDSEDNVWGIGNSIEGQLGCNEEFVRFPRKFSGLKQNISAISCGMFHSLCLDNLGNVWAFGSNKRGQLGLGSLSSTKKPIKISNISKILQISSGKFHNLLIDCNKNVITFGSNESGQLGILGCELQATPQLLKLKNYFIKHVECGSFFSCILCEDMKILLFGRNDCGQLGFGDFEQRDFFEPTENSFFHDNHLYITSFCCGLYHSLFLLDNGQVFGFGGNFNGQLCFSLRKFNIISKPTHILNLPPIKKIACSFTESYFIDFDDNLWISFGKKQKDTKFPRLSLCDTVGQVAEISQGGTSTLLKNSIGESYFLGRSQFNYFDFHKSKQTALYRISNEYSETIAVTNLQIMVSKSARK